MKIWLIIVMILGIVIRFYFHFLEPTFNVDEIALGTNLKELTFKELLYPLNYGQSSPPLYLLLQKTIIVVFPLAFWIKIKILNFICAILTLFLFYKFLIKTKNPIAILMFAMLVFNPFLIYNSLTVKQYGFDLLGVLFLINYSNHVAFKKYNWIFFTFWCLISNIGLFGCAGFLIYNFFSEKQSFKIKNLVIWVKNNIKTFVSPFPYIAYFLWFLNQEGASELKSYMVIYWNNSFIPLNSSIFKYIIYLFHQFWISFYSAYEFWGIFLFCLIIPSLTYLIRKKNILFKQQILLMLCILFVHIILNVLHMYPLSDRLFVYLAPLFILFLGASLDILFTYFKLKKIKYTITFLLTFITIGLYFLYLPYKDNDVVLLFKKISELDSNKTIYVTDKSQKTIENFNDFTDNYFKPKNSFILLDSALGKSNYVISRVQNKLKPNKTSPEETIILKLVDQKRIIYLDNVSGYNIYEIKKSTNNMNK